MSSFRDHDFDSLISHSLKGAYGHKEPSPAVWENIQSQILDAGPIPQSRSPLRGLVDSLRRYAFQMENRLFAVPINQDRLAKQRVQFLANVLASSSANSIPLAVV